MKIFTKLYEVVLHWSAKKNAQQYLFGLAIIESIFFPVPVDVMLAPMVIAQREKAFLYACIATVGSVLGAILGYLLGVFAFDLIVEWIIVTYNYGEVFNTVKQWFVEWGFWVIFIAGFSPVPYKVFTLGAGAFGVPFIPFLLASIVARGARFYLVSGLLKLGGEKLENALRQYVDIVGWSTVAVVALYFSFVR